MGLLSSSLFLDLVAGLVRQTLTGPHGTRASYLNGILLGSRATMRLCLKVSPAVFPHLGPDAIASSIRARAAAGIEDLAAQAGLDGVHYEMLMLAVEMGLDWPDTPGRAVVASELDGSPISLIGPSAACTRTADMLEHIRRLEARGMPPDAIRSTILKAIGVAADGSGMPEMKKETFLAESHRLIDVLLNSHHGAR